MKLSKKILTLFAFALVFSASAFSQTITKFGVIDTSRVFSAYYRDSSAVRNFEQKKNDFQKNVNIKTEELSSLNQRMIEAKERGDEATAVKLEAEITKKAEYLTEYTKAKNIELAATKKRLEKSDTFYSQLYDIIGKIAEAEGYSAILSLQGANYILWYSPSIDITDKVIKGLSSVR